MIPTISRISIGAACLLSAIGLAACGSGDETSSSSTGAESSEASSSSTPYGSGQASSSSSSTDGAAKVAVDDNPRLGRILVDSKGNTLYLFEADKSDNSTCAGACAKAWPPYATDGDPSAAGGAEAKLLGTSQRDDGSTEVTYAGHPLYYYAGDSKPGDATGNDVDQFGAEWYALTPEGETPEDHPGKG